MSLGGTFFSSTELLTMSPMGDRLILGDRRHPTFRFVDPANGEETALLATSL